MTLLRGCVAQSLDLGAEVLVAPAHRGGGPVVGQRARRAGPGRCAGAARARRRAVNRSANVPPWAVASSSSRPSPAHASRSQSVRGQVGGSSGRASSRGCRARANRRRAGWPAASRRLRAASPGGERRGAGAGRRGWRRPGRRSRHDDGLPVCRPRAGGPGRARLLEPVALEVARAECVDRLLGDEVAGPDQAGECDAHRRRRDAEVLTGADDVAHRQARRMGAEQQAQHDRSRGQRSNERGGGQHMVQ